MNSTSTTAICGAQLYLTLGEMQVLSLMATKNVSLKQIKDAVQLLHTTDMTRVALFLESDHTG